MPLTELEQFDNSTRPLMPRARALFGAKSPSRAHDDKSKGGVIGTEQLSHDVVMNLGDIARSDVYGLRAAFRAMGEQVPVAIWRAHLQLMGSEPQPFQGINAPQVYADLANAFLDCGADTARAGGMMSVIGIRELHRASKKVYEVAPGLCEMLHHTELRGLYGRDLKLPYETLYIQIPPGFVVEDGKTPPVGERALVRQHAGASFTGIYVHELVNDDGCPGLIENGGPSRIWSFVLWEAATPYRAEKPLSGTNIIFNLQLYENLKIEESIAASAASEEQIIQDRALSQAGHSAIKTFKKGEAHETWVSAFKLVMNLMMYLHSPDAEILFESDNKEARDLKARLDKLPKGNKKDDLKARYKTLDPQYRYRVGKSLIMRVVEDALQPKQTKFQTNGPLLVRTLVTGHYRRVALGPRYECVPWAPLEERKERRVWVLPFWRGSEDLPTSSPVRAVR